MNEEEFLAHVERYGIPFKGLRYQRSIYKAPRISPKNKFKKLLQKLGIIKEPSSSPESGEVELVYSCVDGLVYTAKFSINPKTDKKSKPVWGIWDHYEGTKS